MTALGWRARPPRLRPHGPRTARLWTGLVPLEARILPAVFTVNSLTDGVAAHPGDGSALTSDGRITLRSAIMEANAEGGPSTIILPAGSYTLSILGPNEDAAATGDLDILAPITVQGAGPATTTITGDGSDRIFDVRTLQNVTIQNLTLTGGNADVGGAIRSASSSVLELDNVVLKNNSASGNGGAIAVVAASTHGQLTLNDVLLQNNSAGGLGGAISMDGLTIVANGVTIAHNTAIGGGGGVAIMDTQHIGLAGAQVDDATLYGNSTPGHGGAALIQAGIVQATDTTVAFNSASVGGGIENDASLGGGNDIVAMNSADSGPDIYGNFSSQGYNFIGDGAGASGTFAASDRAGTATAPLDPLLSSLVVHGGTLPVLIPAPGSPALGVGNSFTPTDERGVTRPTTGADIGAVQHQAYGISLTSGGRQAAGGTAFGTLMATVTEGGQPLPGVPVTFMAPTSGASGTFTGSPTVNTDENGVATAPTFTANFTPGTYNLRASVSPTIFVDIPLTNEPALTDSLQVTAVPSTVQVGMPFQIIVTALTPSGVRDDGYIGTVSFSTDAAAGATLPIPTQFTASNGGQVTFQGLLTGLGQHTIRVSDPNGPAGQVTVNVTPVMNRFAISASGPVTEGQPFAITITAENPQGGPLSTFVGAVTLTSDDPHAVLPSNIVFTAGDYGVKQITGLVLYPPGPHTITATAADGTTGAISLGVTDLGPSGLQLSTNNGTIHEGDTLSVSGAFANPNPFATDTVDVNWGDGSADTVLHLTAGVFNFQAQHAYPNNPTPPNTSFPISVTVTDVGGVSTTNSTAVTVLNSPPVLPPSPGVAVGDASSPFGQVIPFTDAGANPLTAIINYGDGTEAQSIPVAGHALVLNHVYTSEGTYTVNVTLRDNFGGSSTLTEQAVVFRPGTSGIRVLGVPPGQSGTLSIPGAIVTLDNLGGTAVAYLMVGAVNPTSLTGLTGSPTSDPTQLVTAYDIRQLDAGPDSTVTAQLTYANGKPSVDPTVLFYDKTAAAFLPVKGSTKIANSFVINQAGHTATFILGDTSAPTVDDLGGTVFTLSVPAPTPTPTTTTTAANAGTTPFLLASAAPGSPALAAVDISQAVNAPIPTTGLVSSSTLTVAVSAAESLVRGGGDEPLAGRLVNTQTLSTAIETAVEITDFLKEAFRMWLDQPPPMEAPAAVVPPPDTHDQVQLRPATVEAVVSRPVETEPKVVAFDALAVPPSDDVVVAQAESRPWWLAAAPERPAQADQAIPIPAAHEPTTADRAAAAITAVWLGGTALAMVAPEPRLDDEEEWPRDEDEKAGD